MKRREVLAGIGVVAAIGATPVAGAMLTTKHQPSRAAWDRAMAHLLHCKADYDRSSAGYDNCFEAYEAARPSMDMIDAREFSLMDRHRVARTLDIDQYERHQLVGEGQTWWAKDPDAFRAKVKDACNGVREFRRLEKEAGERTGYRAYNERHDAIVERWSEAQDALVALPAPDAEALLWKISYLFTASDTAWTEDYTAQFHSDAARLLSTGRA